MKHAYYYVQVGGSSTDGSYVHGFNTKHHAEKHRQGAIRAAYECGPIISVPRATADAPGFDNFVQDLIETQP